LQPCGLGPTFHLFACSVDAIGDVQVVHDQRRRTHPARRGPYTGKLLLVSLEVDLILGGAPSRALDGTPGRALSRVDGLLSHGHTFPRPARTQRSRSP